ncbi:g2718 [Coccomyxa viridis]|uniref:G2718 protein n=1 Tax=Coccomyxa viridis TaxID=1274662 RepID=A0ABP1FRH8_9CHLO
MDMEKDTRCASAELDCEREGRWSGRLPFQCGHSNAASPSSPHTSEKSGTADFWGCSLLVALPAMGSEAAAGRKQPHSAVHYSRHDPALAYAAAPAPSPPGAHRISQDNALPETDLC